MTLSLVIMQVHRALLEEDILRRVFPEADYIWTPLRRYLQSSWPFLLLAPVTLHRRRPMAPVWVPWDSSLDTQRPRVQTGSAGGLMSSGAGFGPMWDRSWRRHVSTSIPQMDNPEKQPIASSTCASGHHASSSWPLLSPCFTPLSLTSAAWAHLPGWSSGT